MPKGIWSPIQESRFKQDSKAVFWSIQYSMLLNWTLARLWEEWKRINFPALELVSVSKRPREKSIVVLYSIYMKYSWFIQSVCRYVSFSEGTDIYVTTMTAISPKSFRPLLDTVLCVLLAKTHLIFTTSLWGKFSCSGSRVYYSWGRFFCLNICTKNYLLCSLFNDSHLMFV